MTKHKDKPANSIHEKIAALWKEKIKDLNLARQRISIYPQSHPEVIEAVKKVGENFKELLSLKKEITLGVFQDKLLIDGKPLELEEGEEEFQKEFALCLHRREVANLTFSLGLETEDIYKFLKIITADPKTITKQGGIAQLFLENELIYIRINKEDLEEIEKSLSGEEDDKYIPKEYKDKLAALKKAGDEYSEEEVERIGYLFDPIDEEGMARGKILTLAEMLILEKEEKEIHQMIHEVAERAGTLISLGQYKTLGQVFETLRMTAAGNKENIFYEAIDLISFEVIDNLISALCTSQEKSQREEIFALLSHLSRKVVPSLMDRLSKEEDKDNRFILISAITALEKDSAKEVISGLDDPKWYVVRNTVHILRQVKDITRINALLKPIRHKETRVRLETIEALGELGNPEVLSLLVLGLKDKDKQIRELSLRYLVAIGGERSVATLLRILKSNDCKLKMEAISALGEIGSPKAVGELAVILNSFTLWGIRRNNRLKASAARALGKIGGEEAAKALGRGARFSFSRLVKRACREEALRIVRS